MAIILPMEAAELARWRRKHPTYTYWCGTLLGGCGEPLIDRLYHSKVCHFAHHPHHTCSRTSTGEDSADHLFMKRAVHEWLHRQHLNGTVVLRDHAAAPGHTLDVDLSANRRHLRFQFKPIDRDGWRRAVRELGGDVQGKVDWIFGMGSTVPPELLDGDGYVFRIRFETQGAERCPYLGVQRHSGTIEWTPFAESSLTEEGLSTPTVEEIRAARGQSTAPTKTVQLAPVAESPRTVSKRDSPDRYRSRDELVTALREALELDARWGTRPTWKRLAHTVDMDLSRFNSSELRDLLIDVDRPFDPTDPVLSALIRTDNGEPLPYLGSILYSLGLGQPVSATLLKRWCQREADRAFAKYGTPRRTMPPWLPLDAAVLQSTPLSRPKVTAQTRPAQGHRRDRDDLDRLQHLITRAQGLASKVRGRSARHLNKEIRYAQNWVRTARNTELNKHDWMLLREAASTLESAIAEAKKDSAPRQKAVRNDNQTVLTTSSASKVKPTRTTAPTTARPSTAPAHERNLRQRLIEVAGRGGTVGWLQLSGGQNTPEKIRRKRLSEIDGKASHDVPLLSALVVAPNGGPVSYFRGILRDVGLAVPQTDEALMKIWRREQERAYAAYADPPRPLPPRLVPEAPQTDKG